MYAWHIDTWHIDTRHDMCHNIFIRDMIFICDMKLIDMYQDILIRDVYVTWYAPRRIFTLQNTYTRYNFHWYVQRPVHMGYVQRSVHMGYVCHDICIRDKFIRDVILIDMCQDGIIRDIYLYVPWYIYTWKDIDMLQKKYSLICAKAELYMTCIHTCHDIFIREKILIWYIILIDMCHDIFIRDLICATTYLYVTWYLYVTYLYVTWYVPPHFHTWHDIYTRHNTHWYVR